MLQCREKEVIMAEVIDQKLLSILSDGDVVTGWLKAGFFGFEKSGKTFTAVLLGCAVREHFKLDGPISMFDTETGSLYVRPMVRVLTGQDLLAKKARNLDDLMRWFDACIRAKVAVAIVDSMSHVSDELRNSLLAQINERRQQRGWQKSLRLEFQDMSMVTEAMNKFKALYLNAPIHAIVCGRAKNEWEMQERDDGTTKKDLVKTGVSMRAAAEFGYEPSLLVEMERDQDIQDGHKLVRTATVLGDRFGVIDAKKVSFASTTDIKGAMAAVYNFFKPHLDLLCPGAWSPVDIDKQTDFHVRENNADWASEKRQRIILCEEIQGEIVKQWPGQAAHEKQQKAEIVEAVFQTRSWTNVEGMPSERLREGLKWTKIITGRLRDKGLGADAKVIDGVRNLAEITLIADVADDRAEPNSPAGEKEAAS